MRIRWDDTNHYFAKDTSVSQDGSGPWVELSIDASQIGQGTVSNSVLAAINASNLTSGLVALARGGLNIDLTVTGGTGKFLKQSSAGGAVTVVQPAAADISDYGNGTFTPVLRGSSTAGSQTYSAQVGRYIRIGKMVLCSYQMIMTNKDGATAGAYLWIGGLPFTSVNVASLIWSNAISNFANLGASRGLNLSIVANSTVGFIIDNISGLALSPSDLTNTSQVGGSIMYEAA